MEVYTCAASIDQGPKVSITIEYMDPFEVRNYSIILIGLYLRSKHFPGVLHRRSSAKMTAFLRTLPHQSLDQLVNDIGNFSWEAHARLSLPGLKGWASEIHGAGRAISVFDPAYPPALLLKLGDFAPPVFWVNGSLLHGLYCAVLGSRRACSFSLDFAYEAGKVIARQGATLLSGGAEGCDRAGEAGAMDAGGSVVRLIASGFVRSAEQPLTELSLAWPEAEFTTAGAMERNRLIYLCAHRALVVQASRGAGGTWQGATEALRTKACPVYVPRRNEDWTRALCALGATLISTPEEALEKTDRYIDKAPKLAGLPAKGVI